MVRVWGLLIAGVLFITVLPEGEAMNRWWYEWVVDNRFPCWMRSALGYSDGVLLLQDHERCLWTAEPRAAMLRHGIRLLEDYPKCSQDLNPIETAWREVRARLADTEPSRMELRDCFVKRLRSAVAWVNRNRANYLRQLCLSQKERARDVVAADGGHTKH